VGWPAFLPDGKHFFYSGVGATGESKTLVGTLGSPKGKELPIAGSRVEYSPDGYLLLARERTLVAQRFDPGALALRGEPFPIAENLPVGGNGVANFTVSANGILVYRSANAISNRLVWLSRTGQELSEVAPAADFPRAGAVAGRDEDRHPPGRRRQPQPRCLGDGHRSRHHDAVHVRSRRRRQPAVVARWLEHRPGPRSGTAGTGST
jgi:hypothetical protein